jgi:hypothetical protein
LDFFQNDTREFESSRPSQTVGLKQRSQPRRKPGAVLVREYRGEFSLGVGFCSIQADHRVMTAKDVSTDKTDVALMASADARSHGASACR